MLLCFSLYFHGLIFLFKIVFSDESPDKKSMKLLTEMFQMVPVVYIEGGKRIVLSDLMKCYCPPELSSLPPIKEACEAFEIMKNNYLVHLNEVQSRCAYFPLFSFTAPRGRTLLLYFPDYLYLRSFKSGSCSSGLLR